MSNRNYDFQKKLFIEGIMRILVTGGMGFIGSRVVVNLLEKKHDIVILDNLSPQIHGALPRLHFGFLDDSRITFIRADIRDSFALDTALENIESVIHLAAETGTGQSMYQIAHYYEVNQQVTAKLFELICRKHKSVKQVILASSRSVYGEGAYRLAGVDIIPPARTLNNLKAGIFEPMGVNGEQLELVATAESAGVSPASVYAATKLANEALGKIVSNNYGLSVTALRFQNVYGEGQSLSNPYTGLLSIFSNRMRKNLDINIFEDGNESRDFVHVSDVVSAISTTIQKGLSGYNVINIGSGKATSVMNVALALKEILRSNSPLKISGDFRAGDIRHCYADLTVARNLLDFTPQIDLKVGLERFCSWLEGEAISEDRSENALSELTKLGLGASK
ncbi:NAD-dependent epimerase/dehydratase family protein [Robbsia andropogonis]|uniref:NAD-dependent epimerase/dehydratase family protein n=2 Tax=Robbsia andropogonis TaxID=28092 RepID=UPI00209C7A06|nr:NAD-dependent epimerase/dehydratase family protein [Robbsia andropogonis]MCP1121494.1 NAD-dependent epimerase/dehydratase family protein [Robbsia andropogonis]MCP1131316.1 NAD-dependent epimerase/dehydratase family protein [Robbsia andropogonis]